MESWAIAIMVVGAVLGGYIITSVVLFIFPNILHKRKNLKFKPRHISHRGGAGEHLENTMTAFKHAVNLGTDMLEIDCQLTKDNLVVVSHDNSLERVSGFEVSISETDYKDLPAILPSLPLDFDHSHTCTSDRSDHESDTRIPLLREVFEEFPNMTINIDLKRNNDILIEKVETMIREFGREEITVWGNKSNVVAEKCYKLNPNIPLIFSIKKVLLLLVYFYTGLLPFIPFKESCLEIIYPKIILDREKFHRFELTPFRRVLIRILHGVLIKQSLFVHLEKRGIQTYLWVLNNEDDFREAFNYSVTGIMTDFPTKLKNFIANNCSKGIVGESVIGEKTELVPSS